MSKSISITDLVLAPTLSHLRELDLIDPVHTELLAPVLKVLGFDLDYAVEFLPCCHRNMQGKVVVSFVLVGEVECNESFLNSSFATNEDRMIVAGYRDLDLAEGMAASMTKGREYGTTGVVEGFPNELCNPDEGLILRQIKQLQELLLAARGNPYKQDGSLATLAEYGMIEATGKIRKKTKKLAK